MITINTGRVKNQKRKIPSYVRTFNKMCDNTRYVKLTYYHGRRIPVDETNGINEHIFSLFNERWRERESEMKREGERKRRKKGDFSL